MPQTAIQICNSALMKLGEKAITSFEDGSTNSDRCALRYPALRNLLLRSHVWNFTKKVVTLPALAGDSELGQWESRHQLPTDLARILSVANEPGYEVEYEQVQGLLYTNESPVLLRYVANFAEAGDGAQFPDDFAETLACALALDLCIAVTQNRSLKEDLYVAYRDALSTARFNGAIERSPIRQTASSWIEAHDTFSDLDSIDPRLRGLEGV